MIQGPEMESPRSGRDANGFDWLIPGLVFEFELKSHKLLNLLALKDGFKQTIQFPYLNP